MAELKEILEILDYYDEKPSIWRGLVAINRLRKLPDYLPDPEEIA